MSEWQPIETAPMDGSWILLAGGSISYGWDGDGVTAAVTAALVEHSRYGGDARVREAVSA